MSQRERDALFFKAITGRDWTPPTPPPFSESQRASAAFEESIGGRKAPPLPFADDPRVTRAIEYAKSNGHPAPEALGEAIRRDCVRTEGEKGGSQ
jgi:hypothetical protein